MNGEPDRITVEIKDLRKSFGEQVVLDGIRLSVDQGRTAALLGRSGTGKSVLLKILIGLQSPDSGSVRIEGQEITQLDPRALNDVRKKIGFLFQQAALYDSLTIRQNVGFPLRRHMRLSDSERKYKLTELLAGVGLSGGDLEKMPSEISGGMRKRVGLARALALDPKILLLDEPTAGLDPVTAAEIAHLILDLKKKHGVTGVVVTHDLQAARIFSDSMALLHEGKIIAQGTFEEMRKDGNEFVARFFEDSGQK